MQAPVCSLCDSGVTTAGMKLAFEWNFQKSNVQGLAAGAEVSSADDADVYPALFEGPKAHMKADDALIRLAGTTILADDAQVKSGTLTGIISQWIAILGYNLLLRIFGGVTP